MSQQPDKRSLKKFILMSGAVLLIIGMFGLLQPKDFMEMSGLDEQVSQTLSFVLIIAGFADIVTVIILSRLREKV